MEKEIENIYEQFNGKRKKLEAKEQDRNDLKDLEDLSKK